MTYKEKYEQWLTFDEDTKAELLAITDEKEIENRFYKDLEFGTGGLRGIMGAGSNYMNKYTVGRATFGVAQFAKAKYPDNLSVAIAYDTRNNSKTFAKTAAGIFASCGFKVYLYDIYVPVPVLSFTTRVLGCSIGIMITASHNPKEYNGYKVYDNTGCQLCTDDAKCAIGYINNITDFSSIPFSDSDNGIELIGENILSEFLKEISTQSLYTEKSDLKIVYTPLHGTGCVPVQRILKDMNVTVVKEQEMPDGNFSTVRSPNPEDKAALTIAIEKAKEIGADLVLGTDPDCDRVGIAVLDGGDYVLLNGNDVGVLLTEYMLSARKEKGTLPEKSLMTKSFVSTKLVDKVAAKYGCKVVDVLTGFKYVGEFVANLEKEGEDHRFIMGFEESYGYLIGTHARDKDGVAASLMVCEMAAYYKSKGMTLVDALNAVYDEHGFYTDNLYNFVFEGASGMVKMQEIMTATRNNPPESLAGLKVLEVHDFETGTITDTVSGEKKELAFPKSNILAYQLPDSNFAIVRPSGTEPKIKVYITGCGKTKEESQRVADSIGEAMKALLKIGE